MATRMRRSKTSFNFSPRKRQSFKFSETRSHRSRKSSAKRSRVNFLRGRSVTRNGIKFFNPNPIAIEVSPTVSDSEGNLKFQILDFERERKLVRKKKKAQQIKRMLALAKKKHNPNKTKEEIKHERLLAIAKQDPQNIITTNSSGNFIVGKNLNFNNLKNAFQGGRLNYSIKKKAKKSKGRTPLQNFLENKGDQKELFEESTSDLHPDKAPPGLPLPNPKNEDSPFEREQDIEEHHLYKNKIHRSIYNFPVLFQRKGFVGKVHKQGERVEGSQSQSECSVTSSKNLSEKNETEKNLQ